MGKILKLSLAAATAVALALACGSDNNNGTPDAGNPDAGGTPDAGTKFTGTAAVFPVAAAVDTANAFALSGFQVQILDPTKVLAGSSTAAIGQGNLTAGTTPGTGSYSIDIDPSAINANSPGLITALVDGNTTKKQSAPAATGTLAFGGTAPNFTKPTGATWTADAPAFVLPDTFIDKVAVAVLGAGKTHTDLAGPGYILAWVVDPIGAGTAQAPQPTGITGAKLLVLNTNGSPNDQYTVFYPQGLATASPTNGTATDATGVAVVRFTGTTPAGVLLIAVDTANSTGNPAACAPVGTPTTNCISVGQAGIRAGFQFVVPLNKRP